MKTETNAASSETSARLPLCTYTNLAYLINFITGHRVPDLSIDQVRHAARQCRLVQLLATRYHDYADFYYLVWKRAPLEQLEESLADAAAKLAETQRIGASPSGLCLAMAIVIHAIQLQFHGPPSWCEAPRIAPAPNGSSAPPQARVLPRPATVSPAASTESCLPETPDPARSPARSGLTLSDWLQLVLLVNSLAETSDGEELAFREVHFAIQGGYFLQLLRCHAQRFTNTPFMESPPGSHDDLNNALRRASAELRGQEFNKGGVSRNGFCFALALVVTAIRQQFAPAPQPPTSHPSIAAN